MLLTEKYETPQSSEIDIVENEKTEFKLIGKYLTTKGLRLFGWNGINIYEVEKKTIEVLELIPTQNGLIESELSNGEVTVDSRDTFFEALNVRTAQKRVGRWKRGVITELCNLRKPGSISL